MAWLPPVELVHPRLLSYATHLDFCSIFLRFCEILHSRASNAFTLKRNLRLHQRCRCCRRGIWERAPNSYHCSSKKGYGSVKTSEDSCHVPSFFPPWLVDFCDDSGLAPINGSSRKILMHSCRTFSVLTIMRCSSRFQCKFIFCTAREN